MKSTKLIDEMSNLIRQYNKNKVTVIKTNRSDNENLELDSNEDDQILEDTAAAFGDLDYDLNDKIQMMEMGHY